MRSVGTVKARKRRPALVGMCGYFSRGGEGWGGEAGIVRRKLDRGADFLCSGFSKGANREIGVPGVGLRPAALLYRERDAVESGAERTVASRHRRLCVQVQLRGIV